jgi:CubicO group peptidase (beta-lactamase class C family)
MLASDPNDDLDALARRVVEEGVAPAVAVGAARRVEGWSSKYGVAGVLWPEGIGPTSPAPTATRSTVFDLASLTKPVVALTLARLERAGVLSRTEPLRDFLGRKYSAILETASADAPLDALLAHRAGLVAHNPFYAGLVRGERPQVDEVLRAAADMRRPDCAGPCPDEGFPPVYSDLGYLLVGVALELRAGLPLDALVEREVASALALPDGERLGSARRLLEGGLDSQLFAPTEVLPWRGGLVRGVVHDENAWLLAGDGLAGHAGLFGTVGAVVGLGRLILDVAAGRSSWLAPRDLDPLVRARRGGSLAAGFDRRSEGAGATPSSGRRFGPDTFGHLGFTGTSLWMDPARDLVGVLLTNRVCPTREHLAIRAARPVVYDALFEAMCGSSAA